MVSGERKPMNVGLVLLAAGASGRLGRPKQLLAYKGQTLLQNSLQAALTSRAQPVVVVLGANAGTLQNEVKAGAATIITNQGWQEGMASSIRCGINAMANIAPAAEGIIFMVCDQPYISATLLDELITAHQKTGKQIVACGYDGTFGPPVFFHHTLFKELLQLKGDTGAKAVVRQHTNLAEVIPFPEGRFDIDTDADYERIKKQDEP